MPLSWLEIWIDRILTSPGSGAPARGLLIMNKKHYDFLVFIGRFQPFHNGHLAVIESALQQTEQLIVLCGSAHQPRSVRNPWTVAEREAMIRGALGPINNRQVHIAPLMDRVYNDESWVSNVQSTVNGIVTAHHSTPHNQPKIGLIGHKKDHSSYYLNLFPQWSALEVENIQGISATPIRETLFNNTASAEKYVTPPSLHAILPDNVMAYFEHFCACDEYIAVKNEYDFINRYKQTWEAAPYPPSFITADAVVVQSGHVLLVERRARPGKGLFALPGGFVGQDEKLVDACLRQLKKETRLKVPIPVLKGSIQSQQMFDEPYRSARGRTITQVFYIELLPNKALPKVKGGENTQQALWIPLADLDPHFIFEDHYFIIQEMMGL